MAQLNDSWETLADGRVDSVSDAAFARVGSSSDSVFGITGGVLRHNRNDPCGRRLSVERQEPQVGIRRRVGQARHRAEDARNTDLRRFRRVENVRLAGVALGQIRVDSLVSFQAALPILLPLEYWDSPETKGFVND